MRSKKVRMMDNRFRLSDKLLETISGGKRKYAPSGVIQDFKKSSADSVLGVPEVICAWRYW